MLRPVDPGEQEPRSPEDLKAHAKDLFLEARKHYADALKETAIPEIFLSEPLTKYQIRRLAERAERAAVAWRETANALEMLATAIDRTDAHERSKYRLVSDDTGDGVHFVGRWVKKDEEES